MAYIHISIRHKPSSITRLIVPIQSPMLHLRPIGPKLIPKLYLHILLQMARDLHLSDIRRVPLRRDVVVLQDTSRVEVVHVFFLRAVRLRGVVFVYVVDFRDEGTCFVVAVADGGEAVP